MIQEQSIFLSHNSADKDWVRKLAAALKLTGAQVWFDEWTIRPGDSIQTAVADGISGFDIFVLVWSEAAANSRWVQTEMETALDRWISGEPCRLVPVRLDQTHLPTLLRSVRYVNGNDENHLRVARELLGIESDAAFRMAVQDFISEAGLEFREFGGVGVLVACPRCGAKLNKLEGWQATDYERDDQYVGVRCTACGWEDGSEI
jgi:DNA-directed RNA polymerase subunit RPC12/RpoP